VTGVKNVIVNWPETMEGMLEVQRRFTIGLGLIIENDVIKEKINLHQLDFIIEGLDKYKWNDPILRRDED